MKGDQVRVDACEGVPHCVPGEVTWMLSGIACAGDLGRPGFPGSVLYFVLLSRALAGLRKDGMREQNSSPREVQSCRSKSALIQGMCVATTFIS